ncbi:MAG: MFS transporter [Stellaceae bacterium]
MSADLTLAERRWSLAAAICTIATFGVSIGLSAPLLSLLLNGRGIDPSLNGINAAAGFAGVILGPFLAPRLLARVGFKHFLLVALPLITVLFLLLEPFRDIWVWFGLRFATGLIGSAIFTASEAWISTLASQAHRGRIIGVYAAALSAGFGLGPLILSVVGMHGWAPFIAGAAIDAVAMLPLLAVPNTGFTMTAGAHPLAMIRRMKWIVLTVVLFAMYEASVVALMPVWGARVGLGTTMSASLLSAIFFGSIVFQVPIGILSDHFGRRFVLRLCGGAGLVGAALIPFLASSPMALIALLFLWGGLATGIYPMALSAMGDRFSGSELVNANAGLVIGYGTGAFIGPIVGGAAMDLWPPNGILACLALVFVVLLLTTLSHGMRAPAKSDLAGATRV